VRASSLVGHVVEVLDVVRGERRPADAIVREFFRARHYLGASDRRFIAERTFEVLRHHALLAHYCMEAHAALGTGGSMTRVPSIALAAAYELRSGNGQKPPEDLLGDFAGLWRMSVPDIDCAAFLDALRRAEISEAVQRDREQLISLQHSIPLFLVRDWLRRFGEEETLLLCRAINEPAPVTIRVNTLKASVEECRAALKGEMIDARPTLLSPYGLTLAKRVNAQGMHAFKQGWFEMQDEGSQILSLLAGARPGMVVVDACAGGGGKSLHLAALMENRGTLIAVDVDRTKLTNFEERTRRAGVTIARTVAAPPDADPAELRGVLADVVFVDAPCSGTGTLRRSPWLKLGLSEESVEPLTRLQRALLDRYAPLVKPGGRLLYATCSLLERENQAVVSAFLRGHGEFTLLPVREAAGNAVLPPGDAAGEYLELLPHKTGTDGFFGSVMVRKP
jgi:16S rRNA (cytosine967-C5)-methyltransferase